VKRLRITVAILAGLGIVDAAYLTYLKFQLLTHGPGCFFGGCDDVNQSPYSMLLGVPVALWGLLVYVATLGISLLWVKAEGARSTWLGRGVLALSAWGLVFSAYLTALELFVIHAICPFCVISAIIITVIFIVSGLEVIRSGDV
jgi:uncharacterized membrane protein